MLAQTRFKDRAYTDADLQAVTDLLNACDAVDRMDDNHAAEDLRIEFDDPDLDKTRDLHIWEDAEGQIAGFGRVWLKESVEERAMDGSMYMRVHPDVRSLGLEDTIIMWLEGRAREAAREHNMPGRLRAFTRDHDTYGRGIYARHGMSVVRYFFLMMRDLSEPIPEPSFPEGFKMVHSRGIPDVPGWVDMFNQSFIDHWNHHPLSVESASHWLSNPKYKPERDLIAVAPDGTFAAFCFCWIDPADNERNNRLEGWIDILGTRRGYRKIGLGRAMLLSGLHRLKADGMKFAKLGVDAENPTGALYLYESAGFTVKHTSVAYRKSV